MSNHRKLCFDTTFWQHLLASDRVQRGHFAGAVESLAESMRPGLQIPGTYAEQMGQIRPDATSVACEIHSRLYADPERLDEPSDEVPWAAAIHDMLDGMPEWESTRVSVAGDPDFAAIAATKIIQVLSGEVDDLLAASDGDEQMDSSYLTAGDRLRTQLRAAAASARSTVGSGRSALNLLFPKLGDKPPHYAQEDGRRMELIERVLNNNALQRVLTMAGRISRISEDVRAVRDPFARADVVDVELGGSLPDILPSELGGLMIPELHDLTVYNIANETALQFKLEGKTPLGRGPIVMGIDRSGSMMGGNDEWASAAAVALVAQAHKQNRPVCVVEFDDEIVGFTAIKRGRATVMKDDTEPVDFVQTTVEEAVLQIASRRSWGGTDFNVAFHAMLEHIADEEPLADIIFITDGLASVNRQMMKRIEAEKRAGTRIFGLTVGGGSMSNAIQKICDSSVDLDGEDDIGAALAMAIASGTSPTEQGGENAA
jgi:hypothetical protein